MFYYVVPFNLEQEKNVGVTVSEMCHYAQSQLVNFWFEISKTEHNLSWSRLAVEDLHYYGDEHS